MKVYCILIYITSILCLHTVKAQTPNLSFNRYTTTHGLSSGTIYDILRDSFGFIWLATEEGLNRFDGTNFKVYRHNPASPKSLRVNHIVSLFESGEGNIWIGTTGGGLSFYNRKKDSIFNYDDGKGEMSAAITSVNGDNNGNIWVTSFGGVTILNQATGSRVESAKYEKLVKMLNGKVSLCFKQDKKQRVWIGTDNGLYMFNPLDNKVSIFTHNENDTGSLPGNAVNKIVEDQQGNLWMAIANGVSRLEPDGKSFKNYTHATTPGLASNIVFTLAVDSHNRVWIGTEEGLDILNIATNTITNYVPDSRNSRSISSRSIRSVLIDKQGNYWVGTYRGGLNKYDENFNYFKLKEYNAFDPFGLRAPMVTSFAEYRNSVFIGTDGGGVHLYNRNTDLLEHINLPFTAKNGKHDLCILTFEMTKANQLWIGTFSNGLFRYDPASGAAVHYKKGTGINDIRQNDIFCIKEDRHGNIWLGTNGGGINVIRHGSGQVDEYVLDASKPNDASTPSNNFIRAFEEDNEGNIWVGTIGGGISVYNPASNKFSYFNKANSGLPSNYVLSIMQDTKGNMWVGTGGNGLGLLTKGSTRFKALSEQDGLANGTIQKIVEDATGKIWVSTHNGLSCYNPATGKFKNYSTHNGLQSGAFIPRAGLRLQDGELYFGGQNGFNHFNPVALKPNNIKPRVVLTELKVDNSVVVPSENSPIKESILMADEIRLKYKQGFSIAFEALDFTVPEANQYQYILEGFDKDWLTVGKEHSAYYANIPPGNYVFRVKASNNDGVWNENGRFISIIVQPPFWRTIYAYLFYALLFFGLLFYIRNRGIQKIKIRFALEQERNAAKRMIEREREQAEYLHKLDKMKIKFLTNLSHEFRTPISLISGPVDNLITKAKDESSLNHLNLIKRNGRRLLNLVNQLLDFRKMEEQQLKLQCSDGDIVFFTKDVCDSFNDLARRKKIDFTFHTVLTALPVAFDHDKVERILFNLLSNAFKFTAENGHITVTLNETEAAKNEAIHVVEISVKDTGIGIPETAQSRIFESFFQHASSPATLNQGTGIGLSIAREFVKMHDGKISVESKEGIGSTFTFQLKLNRASAAPLQEALSEAIDHSAEEVHADFRNISGSQPSVLIVEDDDDFRFYLKENLKSMYRIYESPNGKEGWQRALFHHPDVIVCDVQMPIMNGLELVQKLKADKRTRHIPVIFLTAADTPNGTLDGLEAGAIDYMTKPFNFSILEAKIINILQLNQAFKDTYSKQMTVSLPETEMVSEKDIFLQKTLRYLYDNLDNTQMSVEILSAHLFISRSSLYNKILEYTGMTPVEFIRSVKLEKAKELLEKTDMTVSAVAYETGFANPTYFTKVFKARYNMTPSEFQAEMKKREGEV